MCHSNFKLKLSDVFPRWIILIGIQRRYHGITPSSIVCQETVASGTRPQPLTIQLYCTHRPGVKCVWVQTCTCRAAIRACTSGCSSVYFCNNGPTHSPPRGRIQRDHTVPMLMTNVNRNIEESTESAPILFQAIPQVISCQDTLAFSSTALIDMMGRTTLPDCTRAFHMSHALTDTSSSNTTTLEAIGSGKINSNRARLTEGPDATPISLADLDIDIMSAGSYGGSDGDSGNVESAGELPTRSAITP